MGQVFKKTTTRPVPSGAKIVEVGGKLTARWKGRGKKAKWMTAPVVTLDDGRQVIRQESSTYFARYRDQDKALITVSTGCRDESAAKQVLADLEKRVERIKSGVLTPAEDAASEQQKRERRSSPRRLRLDPDGIGNAPGEHPKLPRDDWLPTADGPALPTCGVPTWNAGCRNKSGWNGRHGPATPTKRRWCRSATGASGIGRMTDNPFRQDAESEPGRRPSTETPGLDAGQSWPC